MSEYTVTSEIYAENDYDTQPAENDNYVISEFPFYYNLGSEPLSLDDDGDYCVRRKTESKHSIAIEYSRATTLKLVGLQVWRGAFLLADLILHRGSGLIDDGESSGKRVTVLELGSGSGLAGIVAAMKFDRVICTDINAGGILELIARNVSRNRKQIVGEVKTMELDFKADVWSKELMDELNRVNLVIAADVIYDDDLTEAFVRTLSKLFSIPPCKTVYVALEKRYVFTIADLESVAPCYEHFLTCVDSGLGRHWKVTHMPTDFPKFFEYDRCKELVLLKITNTKD